MIGLSLLRKYDRMRKFSCLVTLESMPDVSKNEPFNVLIGMGNAGRNMSVQERWAHGASVILISNTQGICIFMSFSLDIFIQKYPVENIISIAGC